MKLKISKSFKDKLNRQIEYIAKDKPSAARNLKSLVIERIKEIPNMPYKNRRSIFFNREDIRDLIIKGYIIIYKVDKMKDTIEVFGFTKYEDNPFK